MTKPIAAAALLACATVLLVHPAQGQQSRAGAGGKQHAARRAAAHKPPLVNVRCRSADFQFSPEGDLADVVDRDFRDAAVTTVGELRSSPRQFVITWNRGMSTMIGPRTLHYRYLIDRETGRTEIQYMDDTAGLPPLSTSRMEECAINR